MAQVLVGNNAIIPAPFVQITSNPIIAGSQKRLGTTYTLTLNGTLTQYKGSPQAGSLGGAGWGGFNNLFWQTTGYPPDEPASVTNNLNHALYDIEIKQQALQTLFATDGQFIEFESPDGSMPMKCQFKNAVITFPEGTWVQVCPYQIVCETDVLYLNGQIYQSQPFPDLIQNATEAWDIQPGEVIKSFNVSHTVTAVGKRAFDLLGNENQAPWQIARDFVNERLVLGWNGASTFSPNTGGAIFDASSLGSGVINFNSLSPYNFSRLENVDELNGSYSVTESWIAAAGSGTEAYIITVQPIVEETYVTTNVNIQGVLRGFYSNLFDYDQRILAAEWMWSQLEGINLYNRVQGYANTSLPSGFITLNQQPQQVTTDYNINEGSLSYTAQFSNRLFEGDAFETYSVSRRTSVEDYRSVFGIQGSIRGRKYQTDSDPTVAYQRALFWWDQIKDPPTLYNRILANKYFPEASGLGLQPDPINKSIDFNEGDGIITYSFEFNNRLNDFGFSDIAEEIYAVSQHFDVDNGIIVWSINGTVNGLNTVDINPKSTKYQNALNYYSGYASPNMFARVTGTFHSQSATNNYIPQSQEITYNTTLGQISYNFEFKNIPLPFLSGVLSETITASYDNIEQSVNLFASIPIISRISGPVLQNLSTTVVKSLALDIQAQLPPTGSVNIATSLALKPNYDMYISGVAPANSYLETDQETWQYRFGRYSRNLRWIYE